MATLRDRILNIALDHDRALEMVTDGWYRVDGAVVTDPDTETAEGSRVNVAPPPVTEHGADQ